LTANAYNTTDVYSSGAGHNALLSAEKPTLFYTAQLTAPNNILYVYSTNTSILYIASCK